MRPAVQKDELLEILRANESRHRAVFEAAVEGFHKEAARQLDLAVKRILRGSRESVSVRLTAPEDHTRDYRRVIKMVEMHQDDVITLTEDDVAQYIQDDWAWKRQWLQTSSSYAAGTVSEYYDGERLDW